MRTFVAYEFIVACTFTKSDLILPIKYTFTSKLLDLSFFRTIRRCFERRARGCEEGMRNERMASNILRKIYREGGGGEGGLYVYPLKMIVSVLCTAQTQRPGNAVLLTVTDLLTECCTRMQRRSFGIGDTVQYSSY